jgi:DNA polymerase-1
VKLLLVDGHYYVYRSFFAIRELSNSKGEATNAIYGFVKTLRRMVKDLQPDLGAVIWDEGLPERRTQLQPEYKQQRSEMPELMRPQLDFIRKLVPLLGFQSLGLPDTEADDLMASYTCAAARKGMEVVLATNDKDLFQLVNGGVRVYTTNKTEFATPKDTFALLGAEAVRRKWNVDAERIGDVLCLVGDAVDNIPGVKGLGPKNAAALVNEFGSIKNLLQNLASVKNEKLREKLASAREQIEQNLEMVRLDLDLPLPVDLEDLTIAPRYADLIAKLETCEFKTLLQEIRDEAEIATGTQQQMLAFGETVPRSQESSRVQGELF